MGKWSFGAKGKCRWHGWWAFLREGERTPFLPIKYLNFVCAAPALLSRHGELSNYPINYFSFQLIWTGGKGRAVVSRLRAALKEHPSVGETIRPTIYQSHCSRGAGIPSRLWAELFRKAGDQAEGGSHRPLQEGALPVLRVPCVSALLQKAAGQSDRVQTMEGSVS